MRTQICIIGGGPSGLLLAQLLHNKGIDSVVLERKTRDYVLGRVRAGVLEVGFVNLMREAGIAKRMEAEGLIHDGVRISSAKEDFRVDFAKHANAHVIVYGQTEVTRDLYDAREAAGGSILFNVENVTINDADRDQPYVTFEQDGNAKKIDCDFIAGCDGFHGVSRKTIPETVRREYEKVYPFAWMGLLSETPPVDEELIYANSERGFALCSMRSAHRSRYYVQCSADDRIENWPDATFWDELKRRIPEEAADRLVTGPSIEKTIAPLRSFVTEPMRFGKLFLCGDAAHIVPPTGAKGLNTAASDIHYLYQALLQFYEAKETEGIDRYSEKALARVWKAERFSWWMTTLLHRFPDQSDFDLKIQAADIAFLNANDAAKTVMAENYVGLPY